MPDYEQKSHTPESLTVKFYHDCFKEDWGLMVLPGTPITELSDNDLPSPTGVGMTEDGAWSSYILPYWVEKNEE